MSDNRKQGPCCSSAAGNTCSLCNWKVLAVLGLAMVGLFSLSKATTGRFFGTEREADPRVVQTGETLHGESKQASSSQPQPEAEQTSRQQPDHEGISSTNRAPTVLNVADTTFDEEVLGSDVPVLVDFYADWCSPCRLLAPTLEEVARETSNVKVVKVNVDDNSMLAARYGIVSIPSLIVFKDGQVTARLVGLASKADLQALLSI